MDPKRVTDMKRKILLEKVIVFYKKKNQFVILYYLLIKKFNFLFRFCSLPSLCEIVGEYICIFHLLWEARWPHG